MLRASATRVFGCGLLVFGVLGSATLVQGDECSSLATDEDVPGERVVVVADSPDPMALPKMETSPRPLRAFAFTPHRLDECRSFLVFEASGGWVANDTQDMGDRLIVSHSIGLMTNVNGRWAVGGALEAHWAWGRLKAAPAVRVRRWFGGEQSVEASLAYMSKSDVTDYGGEMLGPLVSVRYSPTPIVFAQAGVAHIREHVFSYGPPDYTYRVETRDYSRAFGGVGFTGIGTLVVLGGELVVLGALAIVFAGLSS